MAKNKSIKLSPSKFKKKLLSILSRYKRVKVVFADVYTVDNIHECDCKQCKQLQLSNTDMRQRIIDNKGGCKVSYSSANYTGWSSYDQSCFLDEYHQNPVPKSECKCLIRRRMRSIFEYCNCKPKFSAKRTIEFMMLHDENENLTPISIEYGPRFSKKIKLKP